MPKFFLAAFAFFGLALPAAQAQVINLRTFTCSEFSSLPEETSDFVALWIDGFLADDEEPEGLTVDFSGTDADELKSYCESNPAAKLMTAAEQLGGN